MGGVERSSILPECVDSVLAECSHSGLCQQIESFFGGAAHYNNTMDALRILQFLSKKFITTNCIVTTYEVLLF